MTTNPSAGDTVIPTKTSTITKRGEGSPIKSNECLILARAESTPAARKRHLESSSPKAEVPTKSPRRGDPLEDDEEDREREEQEDKVEEVRKSGSLCIAKNLKRTESRPEVPRDKTSTQNVRRRQTTSLPNVEKQEKDSTPSPPLRKTLKRISEDIPEGTSRKSRADLPDAKATSSQNSDSIVIIQRPQMHQQLPKRDEAIKLRKTIQWLEEGARRMREDLAATRAELHEERRAARLAKRELDSAVKDAKVGEAARHLQVISELRSRLAQSPTRPGVDSASTYSKTDFLRGENHRRELSALRKRLAEAEATVQKLKRNACSPHGSGKRRKVESADGRRLEVEIQALRAANKKLEDRLQVVTEAERKRTAELRIQHENHEAQLAALQRTLRGDTIKMMDEIRSKTREIEKLEKLVLEGSQMHRKLQTKEDDLMRKLRETERSNQIRLAPSRIEEKISSSTDHVESSCNGECDSAAEVERLRELSVEQQEVIEVLRQAVKEKERKLDQISNKKRKEEFYKQWLELEPVVEVEDEDEHEHEEGDSALSSAPSSLSPQPGGCGQWQHTGITREAYETVLLEVEELQTRLVEEQRELAHAKSQVRDLEKALLQETRGSQNSRRALTDKLREIEDREATLVAEVSELREQNELLEFRVLELEETPCLRDTPDPADSGIVSPEPIHLYKDQIIKQRDRAVATVIPYNTYNSPVSPIPQKPPLSLQESGIFDEEDEAEIELASCGTQTETPAGDLLQEVQRLHELRARIQERAVKVPVPVIDAKLYSVPDVNDVIEAGQAASYQERIRELEERLQAHEEIENKRIREKQLSKQREEDLLDENYRLTERIYWFENLIRNSKNSDGDEKTFENVAEGSGETEKCSSVDEIVETNCNEDLTEEKRDPVTQKARRVDSGDQEPGKCDDASSSEASSDQNSRKTITEESVEGKNSAEGIVSEELSSSESSGLEKLGGTTKLSMDVGCCRECGRPGTEIIERLEELVKVEVITKQRIVDLERREATYIKTLKTADETWAETERSYSMRIKELRDKLDRELSANEKLARRAMELEDKLRELRRCSVCQGDVLEHREELAKPDAFGIDEADPFPRLRNYECKKCRVDKQPRIFTPMDVDEATDVVDGEMQTGSRVENGEEKSSPKANAEPKISEEDSRSAKVETTMHSSRNSAPSSVSVVHLSRENDTERTTEYSKTLVPELVAELATEAKEEEVPRKGSANGVEVRNDDIHGVRKAEEAAEEVKEISRQLGNEDIDVDVDVVDGDGERAEAEPLVTINETEPKKKVRQRRRDRNKDREREREREGWVMKAWNQNNRIGYKLAQDFSQDRVHRLVLYQELCV